METGELSEPVPGSGIKMADGDDFRPGTSRALTFEQAVQAWNVISKPCEQEDKPVGFDPDDYPLT